MRCAVAIFAKTIGLSPVKTRLAAEIGKDRAEAFYALSKKCVEAWVRKAQQEQPETFFPVWVLAEEEGPDHVDRNSFPAAWTGRGGLGERLANVSEALFRQYDAAFMIGTDSPHLEPRLLMEAAEMLRKDPDRMVAGPALDGGFYLFASAKPVPRTLWEKVEYSSDTTLDELEWLLEKDGIEVSHLTREPDVDTISDLRAVEKLLEKRGRALLPEQVQLLKWIGSNLDHAKSE